MFRLAWREPGDRYFRKSEPYYDLRDAKREVYEMSKRGINAKLEIATWKPYPSVKWRNV